MEFYTFASSSAGNAALVCSGETRLLIDAGISCRRIEQSLGALSLRLSDLSAVLISHGHIDHVRGLATLQKKCAAPLYLSAAAGEALPLTAGRARFFSAGEAFSIGSLRVLPFQTSHDAPGSVGFRIDGEDGASLATLTDSGIVTDEAFAAAAGAATLLLEANHDVSMLRAGPYPYPLKQRILSERGHLSNDAAAAFAVEAVRAGTQEILLAHLSGENNTPQLAEYTVARALQAQGLRIRLSAAPRDTISEVHLCRRSPSCASES